MNEFLMVAREPWANTVPVIFSYKKPKLFKSLLQLHSHFKAIPNWSFTP